VDTKRIQSGRAIGLHVSISGRLKDSVERAKSVGCVKTFQIFTCSPRRWNAAPLLDEEVEEFLQGVKTNDYNVFCHMPYLPNLCSPDTKFYDQSVSVLTREIKRCNALEIRNLVLHTGSHLGTSVSDGHERFVRACKKSIKDTADVNVRLLIENSAGVKNSVGSRFEDIRSILEKIGVPERTGVCFDTCHAFASGYDLRSPKTVKQIAVEFDKIIGIENLKLIHLNDSKGELGGSRDRHENIGEGRIGANGLKAVLLLDEFSQVPVILETPIEHEGDDKRNLAAAKSLMGMAPC